MNVATVITVLYIAPDIDLTIRGEEGDSDSSGSSSMCVLSHGPCPLDQSLHGDVAHYFTLTSSPQSVT